MPLAPFTIDATPGNTAITVDGEPVDGATAARLDMAVGEIPQLTIVLNSQGTVSGEGNVTYEETPQPLDMTAVADMVRNIDPSTVRERVAVIARTMADDPYAATLDVIADMLEGQP